MLGLKFLLDKNSTADLKRLYSLFLKVDSTLKLVPPFKDYIKVRIYCHCCSSLLILSCVEKKLWWTSKERIRWSMVRRTLCCYSIHLLNAQFYSFSNRHSTKFSLLPSPVKRRLLLLWRRPLNTWWTDAKIALQNCWRDSLIVRYVTSDVVSRFLRLVEIRQRLAFVQRGRFGISVGQGDSIVPIHSRKGLAH